MRVVNVFPTTIDTELVAALDKPKETARDVVAGIVSGIASGFEDVHSCKAAAAYAPSPTDQRTVERQFA